MIGRAPKGLWPAVTNIQRVAFSRLRLYEHYDRDDRLRDALVGFHGEWWTRLGRSLRRLDDCLPDLDDAERHLADLVGQGPAHDYFEALGALAAEAGLDRIPMVGTPPLVIAGYLPSGTPIPAVDTSIAGTDARWDPRTELRADARRRLRHEMNLTRETIEAELARIADDGGYQFPDTSTQRSGIWRLDRDAEWVWWRIRRRWTYEQIARAWERLHPGDFRLQYRLDDDEARQWKADNPLEAGSLMFPAEAVSLVRKAVTTFALRAQVHVMTRPGGRAGRA